MATSLRSAFEYLEQRPGNQLRRLYQQPSTALAVFRRMLPHLAKTIVMAMLYMLDPLPVADLIAWVRPEGRPEHEQAIELLERLNILATIQDPGKMRAFRLSKPFVSSLRLALTGGGDHQSFGLPCSPSNAKRIKVSSLDDFARTRWEGLLYYIVGSAEPGSHSGGTVAEGSKNLLRWGNFVEHAANGQDNITQTGFTFLLQEVNTQVWSLLIVYLENAHHVSAKMANSNPQKSLTTRKLEMDNIELLSFLFTLGSLEVGQDYYTSTLSESQSMMLDDLNDLGIVYKDPIRDDRFYPTRLATTLTSDSNALANSISSGDRSVSSSRQIPDAGHKGYIVVETNYRIYAYTNSPLRVAILSLFTKLSTKYPNMVAGRITKESIQRAIASGITSQQIISYLTVHAHPVMASHGKAANPSMGNNQMQQPSLPPTIVDQIRLWQIEGDRMKTTPGYLFKDFNSEQQYRDCVKLADTVGVLAWRDDSKRSFFATRHEQIASWLKRNTQNNSSSVNSSAKQG